MPDPPTKETGAYLRERGGVVVRVLDAREIIFCVIAIGCDVGRRIRDRSQPVGIVVRIRGDFAVLVRNGRSPHQAIINTIVPVPMQEHED